MTASVGKSTPTPTPTQTPKPATATATATWATRAYDQASAGAGAVYSRVSEIQVRGTSIGEWGNRAASTARNSWVGNQVRDFVDKVTPYVNQAIKFAGEQYAAASNKLQEFYKNHPKECKGAGLLIVAAVLALGTYKVLGSDASKKPLTPPTSPSPTGTSKF